MAGAANCVHFGKSDGAIGLEHGGTVPIARHEEGKHRRSTAAARRGWACDEVVLQT